MYLMASANALFERFCVPPWQMRPSLRATCTMRRPSLMLWLTGFSTYTSLSACIAQIAANACQWFDEIGGDLDRAVAIRVADVRNRAIGKLGQFARVLFAPNAAADNGHGDFV